MNNIFKANILMIIIIISGTVAASETYLTPSLNNKPVVSIDGEVFYEYGVFGRPGGSGRIKKLTVPERKNIISDFAFRKILQREGNIPSIINSQEYELNYKKLQSRNAVEYLKDHIIEEFFISDSVIDEYLAKKDKEYRNLSEKELKKVVLEEIKVSKKEKISAFIRSYLDSLISSEGVFYNEKLFKDISEIEADDPKEFSNQIKSKGRHLTLVEYENEKVSVLDLYRKIRELKPYHLRHLSSVQVLKNLSDGPVLNTLLVNESKKMGVFDNSPVIRKTEDQMKHFVARKYLDLISSEDKYIPSKEEMVDYYIDNKDDTTLWSRKKMWVAEIFKTYDNDSEDEKDHKINVAIELENIRQKIIEGNESFKKYAEFYARPASRNGELGYIFET
ncbi:MAG: hypothetical protein R6V47_04940, partial [Candidatus Delongbacteria bacterium]